MLNQSKTNSIDPLVSVVLPFFNRVNWVIEAINSVTSQTYRNLEIIIIDDNSTENITPILNLIKKDNRITLYKNKVNFGVAYSRNRAIDLAKGEYIAFLDSDDLFFKTKIDQQLKFMLQKGSVVSHTSYELVNENLSFKERIDAGKFDYRFPDIIDNCLIATPTIMARSDVFCNKKNRFPENLKYGEDTCLWISISQDYLIKGFNKVLTKVRKHKDQTVLNEIKMIQGLSNIVNYTLLNHLNKESAKKIFSLNNSVQKLIAKKYSLKIEKARPVGLKFKIKQIIKKIIRKLNF